MAGTIFVSEGNLWSVSSSAFNWVGEFLARNVDNDETRSHLLEFIDNNLGTIALDEFPADERRKLLNLLKDDVVDDATQRLPPNLSDRNDWLNNFRDLEQRAHRASAEIH